MPLSNQKKNKKPETRITYLEIKKLRTQVYLLQVFLKEAFSRLVALETAVFEDLDEDEELDEKEEIIAGIDKEELEREIGEGLEIGEEEIEEKEGKEEK
jgi:hypothetical protein